jgi:hypothetical protein
VVVTMVLSVGVMFVAALSNVLIGHLLECTLVMLKMSSAINRYNTYEPALW